MSEKKRLDDGIRGDRKCDFTRPQLEMYCSKLGTDVLQNEVLYVFDLSVIKELAARLVKQQEDELILGIWRTYIARGEGNRRRLPPDSNANLAVPAEVELLILEALTCKIASKTASGFSFKQYHIVEIEILEAL